MKKLTQRGTQTILPIIGDSVCEVRLRNDNAPALVFRDVQGHESELSFSETICLTHGAQERHLAGARPGRDFDPKELSALVELLGCQVIDALALKSGALSLTFSNQWRLGVTPESGYEAWHFQYPRPGRPPAGSVGHCLSVTGDDGRLICSA